MLSRSRFWIGLVILFVIVLSAADRVRRERAAAASRAGPPGQDEPPGPPATD